MSNVLRKNVLLGAGGHASVLLEIVQQNNEAVDYIVAPHVPNDRAIFNGIDVISDREFILTTDPQDVILINGIGMLPHSPLRERIYTEYTARGYQFKRIVSRLAIVSPSAILEDGVQILPGAIIQASSRIGENSIINTRSIIEHDCTIGMHNHIASGVIFCGGVRTGTSTFIGAGAVVIQNIHIGHQTIVGAGALVTHDIASQHIIRPDNDH